jgi:hypothetical protein
MALYTAAASLHSLVYFRLAAAVIPLLMGFLRLNFLSTRRGQVQLGNLGLVYLDAPSRFMFFDREGTAGPGEELPIKDYATPLLSPSSCRPFGSVGFL